MIAFITIVAAYLAGIVLFIWLDVAWFKGGQARQWVDHVVVGVIWPILAGAFLLWVLCLLIIRGCLRIFKDEI